MGQGGASAGHGLLGSRVVHLLFPMKQILIDLDDATARALERVAPVGMRLRAPFIRLAIRRAVDLALDRDTEAAYRRKPPGAGATAADLDGWDSENGLVKPLGRKRVRRRTSLGARSCRVSGRSRRDDTSR